MMTTLDRRFPLVVALLALLMFLAGLVPLAYAQQPAVAITQTNPVVLGGSCTNQVVTGIAAGSGAPTCASLVAAMFGTLTSADLRGIVTDEVGGSFLLFNQLNADLTFDSGGSYLVRQTTSDGSDNRSIGIVAGAILGTARSGWVSVFGNEEASFPGDVRIAPGNVASSDFSVVDPPTGAIKYFTINGSDGSGEFNSSASANPTRFNNSNATDPRGIRVDFTGSAPNDTGKEFIYAADTGAVRFTVRSNGGIANYQANDVNLSDARTKMIAGAAEDQRALFRRLEFVSARYLDAPDAPLDVMLTAQNVQAVYPELVTTWADGILGVREHGVIMRALKVIQELDTALLALTVRVAELEAR